ncbi:algn-11, partial [Pristionchus pacificus]
VHAFSSTKMIYWLFASILTLLFLSYRRRKPNTIAFFHPYCNAGGGGERVLWCAIRSMQARFPKLKYVIFSGDRDASKEQILLRAKQRFDIEIDPSNVDFIFLKLRTVVEARWYPRFTLLLQTLMGGVLSLEALCYFCPSLMIDSMGYPLSLPIFKWFGGCHVAAYVHYPTISCDMIDLVARRHTSYNNNESIAHNATLSLLKLYYYKTFALAYGLAGIAADVVMVNGSWTASHISKLWKQTCSIVFPPCDIEGLLALPGTSEEILTNEKRVNILSIGQIRPEKDHRLQLEVLKEVLEGIKKKKLDVKVSLTIAGGCRNEEDEMRVNHLKEYAKKLGVEKNLEWKLNVPYGELYQLLNSSLISIHTMRNEHFGISVVEALAAGTIMVAHKSGGPLMDIVDPCEGVASVGYLADTKEEFASSILSIISLSPSSRSQIRESARLSSQRFSEAVFEEKWMQSIAPLTETFA